MGQTESIVSQRTFAYVADRELFVPLWLAVLGGSCGEVVGPVSACVGGSADGGVDVEAEEVGEDRGG
jgi:hypothetical protein